MTGFLLSLFVPLAALSAASETPSFRNDVLPVMSKVGCNSGACHGAAAGRNGFRLSLRGYDPEGDYLALTREALGRRIVKTAPAHSLMLLKPTLTITHGGGKRFEVGSPEYQIIADWIAAGTPPPADSDPQVEHIAVFPARILMQPGAQLQLQVKARYSNGMERDVTRWVKYSSAHESVASVDDQGMVKTRGSGEAAVSVWYASKVSFARVTVPFAHDLAESVFQKTDRFNYIDDLVLEKLQELRIAPSALCTDEEFLRRVHLDTIGVLPTPTEVKSFLADARPDKRRRLIEELLKRPEFVDYWTYKWSDLLLVSSRKLQRNAVWSYYHWVRQGVAENKPWDRFAREVVTATGNTLHNGAANYFVLHKDPIEVTENMSQTFLGMSITCARCHNHPLEKWTQNQYYGMANLFARVSLKNGTEAGEVTVVTSSMGDLTHPRLGKPMLPQPLEGEPLGLDSSKDRRLHLAEWLTSARNPYFARAIVNRVWANFMGRGLVDPVDDLRATNPASNEELFQALTEDFVRRGFDIQHLIRTILQSATYQRSSRTNESNADDDRYYSHYLIRRLPAEVILDAISQVTRIPEEFEGYPLGTRALQLADSQVESYFLSSFGRPPRAVTCECERQDDSNITQALHIINGKTLNDKLRASANLIDQLVQSASSDEALVEEIYLAALSRRPTAEEMGALKPAAAERDRQTLEDLLWAVLTSREFLFNH